MTFLNPNKKRLPFKVKVRSIYITAKVHVCVYDYIISTGLLYCLTPGLHAMPNAIPLLIFLPGSQHRTSLVAPMNVEDADEDFPPHFPAATGSLSPLCRLVICPTAVSVTLQLPPFALE